MNFQSLWVGSYPAARIAADEGTDTPVRETGP